MMDPRNLSFIANATGGELRNASPGEIVTGLCTDSRKISHGDLFVALVGDRFDAHEFLSPDLGRRGGAFLVESERVGNRLSGVPQILVQDSRMALGRLGARYRESFDVYGTKKSFEWSLIEGEPHVLHTAKNPEHEIPSPVDIPDFAHLLPNEIYVLLYEENLFRLQFVK